MVVKNKILTSINFYTHQLLLFTMKLVPTQNVFRVKDLYMRRYYHYRDVLTSNNDQWRKLTQILWGYEEGSSAGGRWATYGYITGFVDDNYGIPLRCGISSKVRNMVRSSYAYLNCRNKSKLRSINPQAEFEPLNARKYLNFETVFNRIIICQSILARKGLFKC